MLQKKNMIKIFCLFLIAIIIFPSYSSLSNSDLNSNLKLVNSIKEKNRFFGDTLNCYGIIIPQPSINHISNNPNLQYQTLNLINDLLRNDIVVYNNFKSINFTVSDVNTKNSTVIKNYQKGTFFIPFSGDEYKDTLVLVILSKYINSKNDVFDQFEYCFLVEPISFSSLMKLNQAMIAYYFDEGVTIECLDWYVSTLYRAGFLQNQILSDQDVIENLTNDRYNVFIWPGGRMMEGIQKNLTLSSRLTRQSMMKNFVYNGGGYVGSCYGAFAASSGMRFTPFLLAQYYKKNIPSFGFLSLSDTLLGLGIPSNINVTVKGTDSPVLFGLNDTIPGSILRGGPVYTWVGKNTEELATIDSIDTSWFRFIESMDNQFLKKLFYRWVNFTIGKTIWVSSKYNDGKIVTFGDHPEHRIMYHSF